MNVPLSWLAEYVKLPKDTKVLTDRLTAVGHMLDKITKVGEETVIDLELRGNRADMFGLIGVAREVAAVMGTDLKMPQVALLPRADKNSPLVKVQPSATDLVTRYTAIKMTVKVGPSPAWLADRLVAYGIPVVNNVVDVTNYVMVETSHPLHAFDYDKINGGQLILRRAKREEKFATVQQGTTLTLSDQDLAIADRSKVQCLSIIGGLDSRVTDQTSYIILESAVYNPVNCRRTARRLKTITEGGARHEKHQDPHEIFWALARAADLLKQIASARIEGQTSDYYPHPVKSKTIKFEISEVARLTGLTVPTEEINKILTSLEFKITGNEVTVPTFRTDIEGSADIVEEIVRIYGYDKIPETPFSDQTPEPMTYPSYAFSEKLRNILTSLGLNEVITLTMVEQGEIALVNPPDPDLKWLRANIYPSLVNYCRKRKINIFEIGNTFTGTPTKYKEHTRLSIAVTNNLTGVLQKLESLLGVNDLPVKYGKINEIFWAEIDLDKLLSRVPRFINPYSVVSQFPPIIEDVNIRYDGNYGNLIAKIKKISSLIKQIDLIDKYNDKLTLRITYHSNSKQLSSADIAQIRQKLESIN